MTLISIVLSQSSPDATGGARQSNFHIRMPHEVPVTSKKIRLVGYQIMHAVGSTTHKKNLSFDIDWLSASSSHTVGSSANELNKTTPDYAFDIVRRFNKSVMLATNQTYTVEYCNLAFETTIPKIPANFIVKVTDSFSGLPYTNVLFAVLHFNV